MKRDRNRQFRLRSRPTDRIEASNFDFIEEALPEPDPGQALVRVLYLSLDPTNRVWMSDREQYMRPVELGEVMRGGGIGVVVRSNSSNYRKGDYVVGFTGWQDYCLADESNHPMRVLPPDLPVPLPTMLGACGTTGLTAYFGLLDLGRPKSGETVVVSAAAGAVGSVAGQIAALKGCRTVGIAGGPDKCRYLLEELGFNAAVDRKASDWEEQLIEATPDGVDVNFENVGGEIMHAVMARMNLFSRMPLCGLISAYNASEPPLGDFGRILMKRISVRGFIVLDFAERFSEGTNQLIEWVAGGKIKHRETIVEGLEQAPTAVNLLFDGNKMGKLIVKVADP